MRLTCMVPVNQINLNMTQLTLKLEIASLMINVLKTKYGL